MTGRGLEDRGSETQALESFRSCEGEAGPPTLQTVALAALTGDPSGSSVQHVVRLLKEGGKSQTVNLSQGKERSTVSGASRDCGEPPGRKTTAGSNDGPDPQGLAHPRGPRDPPAAGAERRQRWRTMDAGSCGIQEASGSPARLEPTPPPGPEHAEDAGRAGAPWASHGRRGGLGSSGEQGGRDLRRPRPPVSSPSILGSSPPAVVTSKHPCALPKQRKKSRPSGEMMQGKRRIAELTGQVTRLQAERSLHGENAQLAREAQKLQLPLPAQPHVRVEHVPHLERKAPGEKAGSTCTGRRSFPGLQGAGRRPSRGRPLREDGRGPAQRIAEKHLLPRPGGSPRQRQSRRAALWAEREVCELRRQSHHLRQRVAKPSGPRSRPCPGDPVRLLLLLQPPGVRVGHGLPCVPRCPRRERRCTTRPPGPGVACRSDATSWQPGPGRPPPGHNGACASPLPPAPRHATPTALLG